MVSGKKYFAISFSLAMSLLIGCSSNNPTTQPSDFNDRQQAALKDPMGYKVPPNPDVSDDNTTGLDKNGLQRDVNDVLNP
jgi:hypothetical protein